MVERRDVRPVEAPDHELGMLLAMLDAGTAKWRRELGRVSKAAIVWQPFPNGHSIGGVLLHIAHAEAYWVQ